MSVGHDARWEDAAAAYLLHALPEDEVAGFEAHLRTCAGCRDEVDRLRVAAEALPSSPVQYEPPPELKLRIMSIVNAEAELLQAAGDRADEPKAVAPPRERRRFGFGGGSWSLRPGLAIAGVAAVLALGVLGGVLGSSALRGDESRTVAAQVAPPGSQVRLVVREDGDSTLVADRMPSPGRGRVWQVWKLKRGETAPEPTNALFDVRSDGSASVVVPGSLDDVQQVLVSSEPAGGSQAPTTDPVLSVTPA